MGGTTVTAQSWDAMYGVGPTIEEEAEPEDFEERRQYLDACSTRSFQTSSRSSKEKVKKEHYEIPCLRCDKPFKSWDKKKNRICGPCRAVNRKDTGYQMTPDFERSLPRSFSEIGIRSRQL